MSDDVVEKFLLHEAVHVGYPEHDDGFERVAAEVGTAVTENLILGGDCVVEREVEGTFVEVCRTKSRSEALAFASERRAGAGRYCVSF